MSLRTSSSTRVRLPLSAERDSEQAMDARSGGSCCGPIDGEVADVQDAERA
jgi:hypothetical protein